MYTPAAGYFGPDSFTFTDNNGFLTSNPATVVINAAGVVSLRAAPGDEITQRQLLEREGIVFDARGRVPLARVRWRAGARRREPAWA